MMALGSLSLPPHCIVQLSFACIFCWIARAGSRVLLVLPLLLRGIYRYENKARRAYFWKSVQVILVTLVRVAVEAINDEFCPSEAEPTKLLP